MPGHKLQNSEKEFNKNKNCYPNSNLEFKEQPATKEQDSEDFVLKLEAAICSNSFRTLLILRPNNKLRLLLQHYEFLSTILLKIIEVLNKLFLSRRE